MRIGGPRNEPIDTAQVSAAQAEPAARAPVRAASAARGPEPGKLLTKKMAGERVLLRHLDGRIGAKYEAKVAPGADRDHYAVKMHRRRPSPPFDVAPDPEAIYSVDRRDGTIERLGGPAPSAAPARPVARDGALSLGEVARPGRALRGTALALRPGESLVFRTRENQIYGLGQIRIEPRGALEARRKLLEASPAGRLGGASLYEYRFSVPEDARPGSTVRVATGGHFQSRNDPDWAFEFKVAVK